MSSREIILDHGVSLIARGGFEATGLDAVLKASGVPKGSFYYYFESKEDFGIAVLERFADRLLGELEARFEAELGSKKGHLLKSLAEFFEASACEIEKKRCECGCLIGNLSQELAGKNASFRQRVDAVFERWESIFEKFLLEASRRGEVGAPAKAQAALQSRLLLIGWQGAVLRSKAKGDPGPIREWVSVQFPKLNLKKGDAYV